MTGKEKIQSQKRVAFPPCTLPADRLAGSRGDRLTRRKLITLCCKEGIGADFILLQGNFSLLARLNDGVSFILDCESCIHCKTFSFLFFLNLFNCKRFLLFFLRYINLKTFSSIFLSYFRCKTFSHFFYIADSLFNIFFSSLLVVVIFRHFPLFFPNCIYFKTFSLFFLSAFVLKTFYSFVFELLLL